MWWQWFTCGIMCGLWINDGELKQHSVCISSWSSASVISVCLESVWSWEELKCFWWYLTPLSLSLFPSFSSSHCSISLHVIFSSPIMNGRCGLQLLECFEGAGLVWDLRVSPTSIRFLMSWWFVGNRQLSICEKYMDKEIKYLIYCYIIILMF